MMQALTDQRVANRAKPKNMATKVAGQLQSFLRNTRLFEGVER
jgi:hypothetical protein